MPKFAVHKSENFTIICNHMFYDRNISYQAKGLLAQMLSLPPEWDYTEAGLAKLARDGKTAVHNTIVELEKAGYVTRTWLRSEKGVILDIQYDVYEIPWNAGNGGAGNGGAGDGGDKNMDSALNSLDPAQMLSCQDDVPAGLTPHLKPGTNKKRTGNRSVTVTPEHRPIDGAVIKPESANPIEPSPDKPDVAPQSGEPDMGFPSADEPEMGFPYTGCPCTDNIAQLSTNELNINQLRTHLLPRAHARTREEEEEDSGSSVNLNLPEHSSGMQFAGGLSSRHRQHPSGNRAPFQDGVAIKNGTGLQPVQETTQLPDRSMLEREVEAVARSVIAGNGPVRIGGVDMPRSMVMSAFDQLTHLDIRKVTQLIAGNCEIRNRQAYIRTALWNEVARRNGMAHPAYAVDHASAYTNSGLAPKSADGVANTQTVPAMKLPYNGSMKRNSANSFLNFEQRRYDYDALERMLLCQGPSTKGC